MKLLQTGPFLGLNSHFFNVSWLRVTKPSANPHNLSELQARMNRNSPGFCWHRTCSELRAGFVLRSGFLRDTPSFCLVAIRSCPIRRGSKHRHHKQNNCLAHSVLGTALGKYYYSKNKSFLFINHKCIFISLFINYLIS